VVLAFRRRPDAALREVVGAGGSDLLLLPVDDDELGESLFRAVELARRATQAGGLAPPAAPARRGHVFTIASATGGCGKTFYATNLAAFLSRHTGGRVCLVDLDLQFGEVSTALRLRPRFTIYDALHREDGGEVDLEAHVEEYLEVHDAAGWVLAAPRDPSEADRITPPDVTRVVEALRSHFDYIVVDTPGQLHEVVLAAFDLSDLLYIMATLDLPSVRNAGVFLATLEKLKIPSEAIRLVLNKAESDVGIEVDQIERLFPQGFTSVLPYAKEVSRSINLGVPVLVSSPEAPVSRRLAEGMFDLLPDEARQQAEAAVPAGPSLWERFLGRTRPTPLTVKEAS
jgi:pilus assembly protein CpaE